MTLLDKIKTEYMMYELEAEPASCFETIAVLDVFLDDMKETVRSSKVAARENFRDEQLTKVKNFFLDLFGYEGEDIEQFGKDMGIVLRHGCLGERYGNYFSQLKSVVSDDNYIDICRLAMFTYKSYTSNYDYLQRLRTGIKLGAVGIRYMDNSFDSQGDFGEFFADVFSKIEVGGKKYGKRQK